MGTRADFYVGRGKDAEWIGSVAYDGYPDGLPDSIRAATDEAAYRSAVAEEISIRDDGTKPSDGWPWPWNDSHTTDYAYAFDGGSVHACPFGHGWYPATLDEQPEDLPEGKTAVFPDMGSRKAMAAPGTARSGLMVFSGRGD